MVTTQGPSRAAEPKNKTPKCHQKGMECGNDRRIQIQVGSEYEGEGDSRPCCKWRFYEVMMVISTRNTHFCMFPDRNTCDFRSFSLIFCFVIRPYIFCCVCEREMRRYPIVSIHSMTPHPQPQPQAPIHSPLYVHEF